MKMLIQSFINYYVFITNILLKYSHIHISVLPQKLPLFQIVSIFGNEIIFDKTYNKFTTNNTVM